MPTLTSRPSRGRFNRLAGRGGSNGADGGQDISSEGSSLHSLSIGKRFKEQRGTEFTPGTKHLDQISGGGIRSPKMIDTATAKRAETFKMKFEEQTKNSVQFYKNAKEISSNQTKVHAAWADMVQHNMDQGFQQYTTNTGLAQKDLEVRGKRLAEDWKLSESQKGLEAQRQEFQVPVSSRMRQYA